MRSYAIVAMAATAAALVPPSAPRRPLTPMQGFFDAFKNESFDSAPKGGLSNAPAAKQIVMARGYWHQSSLKPNRTGPRKHVETVALCHTCKHNPTASRK